MSDFTAVQLLNQLTPVIITGGYVPRGAYAAGTDYAVGDSVDYNGSSYVMFVDAAAGTAPTDTTKWQVLANKGDTGSTGATGSTGSTGATGASITSAAFSSNDIVFTKDDTNTVTLTDAAITLKGATGATGGTGTLEDLGGATKALDNLASVAINTSLISDTDSTDDLGSTSKAWANLYVDTIKSITGNALALTPVSGQSLTVNLATTGDFVVNTNQLYVDTSAGNVGIGTTSPSYSLDVAGGMRGNYLLLNNSGGASSPSIQLGGDADTGIFGSANTVAFTNNGTEAMRIISGNVGIGTTSPQEKISIFGGTSNINIGGNFGGGYNGIWLNGDTSSTNYNFLSSASDKNLYINRPSGVDVEFREGNTATNQLVLKTGGVSYFNAGNVGIGTTSPTAKLDVVGQIRSLVSGGSPQLLLNNGAVQWAMYQPSGSNDWRLNDGIGDYVTVKYNSGNVGIGTTAPTNILSLGGNSARIFWTERNTVADTLGNNLTVRVGGATAGATNKGGGSLILAGGISTGTGTSDVQIQTCPAGSTGTSDNTLTTIIQATGNGLGFFGHAVAVQQAYTAVSDPPTQAQVTAIRDALINLGLMAAS